MLNSLEEPLHVHQVIMIIDDEEFMVDLISDILLDLGVPTVLSASDGQEALAKLSTQSRHPDLLICDLCMPGMDGIEFLRRVCEQGYRGDIILLSGLDGAVLKAAEQLARSYAASMLGVLGKPIDREALRALMGRRAVPEPAMGAGRPGLALSAEEIREAFADDRILVFFQPKVAIQGRKVVGAECLARLRHPERGIVGPDMFIPGAEQYGLIDELTLIVFRKAVAQAKKWLAQGEPIKVSVNVSMDNMSRLDFPDILDDLVQAAGVAPESIILEVTETKLPENFLVSLDILIRLRIKGFILSVDDFGTGYSTLESLKCLPFNELKIDRAFVSGAHRDASSRAFLESSARLGKQLNLRLVAEGVETQEEWDFVAQAGCHEVQGFFVAKPMPAEEFDAWRKHWESTPRPNREKLTPALGEDGLAVEYTDDCDAASAALDSGKPVALVVDDEEFMLELVRDALSGCCRVFTAEDGEAALACIAAQRPDIVVVDVEMPVMNGYETCRRIRQESELADVPVLFLSAKDAIEDRLKGYDAGGDDYMTKPFEQQLLKAKVNNLLSLAEQRRQLRESANFASSTAMTAMTSMSEMGLILESLKRFNASTTYRELADAVLQGAMQFGLESCVQLRAPSAPVTYTDAGPASPLDVSIIEHMLGMERIVQFKTRLSISYEHVTLLIKNMPVDDAELCGRLRDHLAMLADAAGVRLLSITATIESQQRGGVIDSTIQRISKTLCDIDEAQRQSRTATAMTVNSVIETVEQALVSVALTDDQEAFVSGVVRDGLDRIVQEQGVEADIQNQLSSIVKELNAALYGS